MNFGDILDEWDRETAKPCGKKKIQEESRRELARDEGGNDSGQSQANPMDVWLRRYGTVNKDALLDEDPETITPAEKRRQLHAMKPESVIDLHGLTREVAWSRLESFFSDSIRRGFRKVLVIHGKGTHSADDPVLGPMVRLFLEQNRHAGESGSSEKDSGGSGATWVILK